MIISFFHLIRGRDRAGYFGTKYGKAKRAPMPLGATGDKQNTLSSFDERVFCFIPRSPQGHPPLAPQGICLPLAGTLKWRMETIN